MKICPTCKRSYLEETQTFCLEDGARLINQTAEVPPPTIAVPFTAASANQQYVGPAAQPFAPQPYSPPPQYGVPVPALATARKMGLATVALILGFVCLALMIHLTYMLVAHWWDFVHFQLPQIVFSFSGIEFFFGLALVTLTVVLAAIAIAKAFRHPAFYAGRGRSLAAVLMALLSTVVVISMFTVRRFQHSTYSSEIYTPSTYTPSTNTPPSTVSARDLIKQNLGPFTLVKTMGREDIQKVSSGETLTMLNKADDVAAGSYRSSTNQYLSLFVFRYPSRATAADQVDTFERSTQGLGWRDSRTTQQANGKRIQAQSVNGGAFVLWNNGSWLFITYAPTVADAVLLADSVGY